MEKGIFSTEDDESLEEVGKQDLSPTTYWQMYDNWVWYGVHEDFEEQSLRDINPLEYIPKIGPVAEWVDD